jgi:hypothetical protein
MRPRTSARRICRHLRPTVDAKLRAIGVDVS